MSKKYDDDWGLISFAEFEEMEPPTDEQIQAMQEIMDNNRAKGRGDRLAVVIALLLVCAALVAAYLLLISWGVGGLQ